ncbi:MAG TPA: HD domain-containing phosphohydrolase [Acidimicrobiales bacterium]|nr:HD domain-containing phosphohydrolase [Acidimicrobiales bacterium]
MQADMPTARQAPSERRLDLSALPSAAQSTKTRCAGLLRRAATTLRGSDGAVFAVGGERAFEAVATLRDSSSWLVGPLKEAARAAAQARQPLIAQVTRGPVQRVSGTTEQYLAVPLEVDRELLGVLMVIGLPSSGPPAPAQVRRLGAIPELLALVLERLRMLGALDKRGADLTAVRRQLDAFALDFRSTYQAERDRSTQLGETLAALERSYKATVGALAMAVEAKDSCTGGHLQRVSRYGMLLTSMVAPEHAMDPQFEYGFLLHDVGKLMVPDMVLNKPGPLSEDEWQVMRAHPGRGRSILDGIEFLAEAQEIIYAHHERWDGKGYPRGLRETEIPLGALIFPLCDAFDAMTSERPYRPAMPCEAALAEVRAGAGTQFWSVAVDAFLSIPRDILMPIMGDARCTTD